MQRPRVSGKFLSVGNEKLWVRGVTYGAFRPDVSSTEYHNLKIMERDFAQMVESGLNTVRIPHTMPSVSLLDAAQRHGLYVMGGLSAEQYVGYLIDKKDIPDIEEVVHTKVRTCAGHPALLCYAIGNEIPAPLVRWLGRRRVSSTLSDCTGPSKPRTRTALSPTSTIPRPSICSFPSWIWCALTSIWRHRSAMRRTLRACRTLRATARCS